MGPETRESEPRQTDADSLCMRIVDAVADATGTDPLDLPPLYDAVDTDRLADCVDQYRRSGSRPERVAFDYAGCRVEVGASGAVDVLPSMADGGVSAPSDAADRSRTIRHERGGQERVLVTEPDREGAWLQSDRAVVVEE